MRTVVASCCVLVGCPADDGLGSGSTSSSTSGPPAAGSESTTSEDTSSESESTSVPTCDAAVMLSDPLCEACVAENCCTQLLGCFGDAGGTPCAALHTCASANCLDVEGETEFS